MFEQNSYCPYTGLRSFTEEEAIYFKGRDQHIEEATQQLEDRKFLMLTGSSGDGKSSLVYAGIVPFARAGFLKSQFSNWIVADFKPERTPFNNLCAVLADKLEIPQASVKAELNHGYSSLIELYKNSKFYHSASLEEDTQTDDLEKQQIKRQSSNLLILADQFEEFFTNPENYFKGVTSQESNLVINLLLETARIAKEENLPIYVVCTMRSDYIGQCAAFRGLPEFIGYSQFFVPRLIRKQLREVIEEPAILSGNRISNRLVERLIHDIVEGVDQLPILQHALNQIWRSADEGKEEMDLIHYAMVGGMSASDLPEDDKNKFNTWFDSLSEKIRSCYETPSLQNVLNTHANKLYVSAADYYNEISSDSMSEEDAKHVIHNVFVCLTKIDHARAVRNRMTLQEIKNITDIPGLTTEKIRILTAPFRAPHNTMIQPYIDESGNDPLGEDDILDISHESLIRNWTLLKTWAKEEYGHVNTFNDLSQQVERWIDFQRSSDYLLPIGPLSHFETWIKKIEPNKYWVSRYNQEIEDKDKRLVASDELLSNTFNYINASNQKHLLTRAVMRLGARKIIAAIATLSFILFSSFYIYEEYSHSVDVVANKIIKDGTELLYNDNTDLIDKVIFTEEMIRTNPNNFKVIFSDLEDPLAVDLAMGVAQSLLNRNQHNPHFLIDKCINHVDSLLNKMYNLDSNDSNEDQFLKNYVDFLYTLELKNYHQSSKEGKTLAIEASIKLASYVLENIQNNDSFNPSGINLNNAIEFILNNKSWTLEEINQVIGLISPLESNYAGKLKAHFKKENSITVGRIESIFTHHGLYQELAYLYASVGNVGKTLECIDTLMTYNNGYFAKNYNLLQDNATNIAYYFLEYNYDDSFLEFVNEYCKKSGVTLIDFLDKMAGRSIISVHTTDRNINYNSQFMHNSNLEFMSKELRKIIFKYFEDAIQNIPDQDKRNFRLALLFKHKALFEAQHSTLTTGTYNEDNLKPIFQQAMDYYNLVPSYYLQENDNRTLWGARQIQDVRKAQFIFPGYLEYQSIWIPRFYSFHYFNTSFLNFLNNEGFLNEVYTDNNDFKLINEWSSFLISQQGRAMYANFDAFINFETLHRFLMAIKSNSGYKKDQLTSLKVITARRLFEESMDKLAMEIANEISYDNLPTSLPDIANSLTSLKFTHLGHLAFQLTKRNESDLYEQIINAFDRPVNKGTLLGYSAQYLGYEGNISECRLLLNRAKEQEKLKISENGISTSWIILTLMILPDLEGYDEARKLWKNFPAKTPVNNTIAYNLSYNGDAWKGYEDIEPLLPADRKMTRLTRIGAGIRKYKKLDEKPDWNVYDQTNDWFWSPIFYTNN